MNTNLKCPTCGGKFNSQQELADHAKKTHADQPRHGQKEHSIICSKCGFKAKAADEMQSHSCATC